MITTFKGLADGLAKTPNLGLLPSRGMRKWTPMVDFAKRTGVPTIMVNPNMFTLASEFRTDCTFLEVDPFYKRTAQYVLLEWVRSNDPGKAKLLEEFNDDKNDSFSQMLWIGRIPDYNGGDDYYLYFGRMKRTEEDGPSQILKSWGRSYDESEKSPSIFYGLRMSKCAGAAGPVSPNQNFSNALKIAATLVDFEKTSMDAFSTSTVEMLPTPQQFVREINQLLKNAFRANQSDTPTNVSFVLMKARKFQKNFLEVDAGGVVLDVHPIMKKFMSYEGNVTFYLAQLAYDPIFVWIRETPSMLQIWETAIEIVESPNNEERPSADIEIFDSTVIPIEISTFSQTANSSKKMQEIAEIYESKYNTQFPKDGFIRIQFGYLPDWAKKIVRTPVKNEPSAEELKKDDQEKNTTNDEFESLEYKVDEEERENFKNQINEQGWKETFEEQTRDKNWRMHGVVRAYNEKIKELNLAVKLAEKATYKNISDLKNIPKAIRKRVNNFAIYLGEVDKTYWYILQEKDARNVFYLFKSTTLLEVTDRAEMDANEKVKAYNAVLAAKDQGKFMHADYLK